MSEVPAIGFSTTVNLNGDRQIVFQGFFPADHTDADANALLDRVMRLADRQQAYYERQGVVEELRKHQETLAQFHEDRDRIEVAHATAQAERQVMVKAMVDNRPDARKAQFIELAKGVKALEDQRQGEFNAGERQFQLSGRKGDEVYEPRGTRKANLERIDTAIAEAKTVVEADLADWDRKYDACVAEAKAEIDKAEAERTQAQANLAVSIKRYEDGIASRQARLDEISELLKG